MRRFSRTVLALTGGHLLSLSGFEWSRMWAFFPGPFRIMTAVFVTLACLLCLQALVERERRMSTTAVLLAVWCSISGFILLPQAWDQAVSTGVLGVVLCAGLFRGRLLLFALLGTTLLVLAALASVGTGWMALLLLVGYAFERRHLTFADLNLSALESLKDKRPGEALAEISWGGFAQLYSACAKGEGEKFSRRVLADTVSVVQSCGGELQSGSEHRGVYRFPTFPARRECQRVLLEYQDQLDSVLEEVNAPVVRVYFREM